LASTKAREWKFDYAEATELLRPELPLDTGDVVALVWNGDFRRPCLAPPGCSGRPAIVVAIEDDWLHGLPAALIVSLLDEGVS
jgi:hypothetical protein